MPITLEGTVAGRHIAATAEARGRAIGEAEGQAIGTAQMLAAILRRSFGHDPRIEAIATHLAALPHDQALDTALTATTLDDLTIDGPGPH